MQWLSESASTLLAILPLVPWGEAALSVLLGIVCGLALGFFIVAALHKSGLLRRKTRWLRYAVKSYWLLIPALLAFAGAQIGLARCVWHTADRIIVAHETQIRDQTRALLATVQTELDALIKESPSLKDVSFSGLIDAAIDRAIDQLPAAKSGANASITDAPLAYALAWFKRAASSASLRQTLRANLVDAVQKTSGIDRTTIETALATTLGQMADGNIVSAFARERLYRFFWSFVNSVLLFAACLLLIPAAEIGLAKWRKW